MATHTKHYAAQSVHFVTFTCYKWLPLFKATNAYDAVYTWFYHIKDDAKILGYVVMPNHVHLLTYLENDKKTLNQMVGTGKRFLTYEIVKRLKRQNNQSLLQILRGGVSHNDRAKRKQHRAFRLSFHAKICESRAAIEDCLDYIHANPVAKKWNLVDDLYDYEHSSAAFYMLGKPTLFPVTHYMDVI
ncbi:transposase [Pseudoalteromonas sp.]|uniref:transposase n=1 Tax=Pseudoalteromonas sp. TaxID=53249 RepID=UPI002352BB08|nr:transposase [Pseudoalteromonas sp.]